MVAQISDYAASLRRLSPAGLLAEASEALRLRPDDPEAHTLRAAALMGLGRPEEALAEASEALRLRPDDPEAHTLRAAALMGLGRPKEASVEASEALRLRPDDPEAHTLRAAALTGLGRPEEAQTSLDALRQLASADPNFAWLNSFLKTFEAMRYLPSQSQFVRNLMPSSSSPPATPSQAISLWEVMRAADNPSEKVQRVTESMATSVLERTEGEREDARRLGEEEAIDQFAAATVDRMIAALDTATATVEAQLAELRRMRRAA